MSAGRDLARSRASRRILSLAVTLASAAAIVLGALPGVASAAYEKPPLVSEANPPRIETKYLPNGKAYVGGLLVCYPGSWEYVEGKFEYEWFANNIAISNPAKNPDEFVIRSEQAGTTITCAVRVKNAAGWAEEESWNAVEVPGEKRPPPQAGEPGPAVTVTSGKAPYKAGETVLACSTGKWTSSSTITYSYTWLREGETISGATESKYATVAADSGYTISCRVTATNSDGASYALSNGIEMQGTPPQNVPGHPPQIEGTAAVEQSLTCKTGTWEGAPAPQFSYRWLLAKREIAGATSQTYRATSEDALQSLSCEVIATNHSGTQSAESAAVTVAGIAPSPTSAPIISGTAEVGKTLTCENGTWNGAPKPVFAYQWLREGEAVPLATQSTYVVAQADVGHSLTCRVTASNGVEPSRSEVSKPLLIAGSAPVDTLAPEVKGSAMVGERLTCSKGAWSGDPEPSFTYQWLRSGAAISGAIGPEYEVAEADIGKLLSCRVTATNTAGKAEKTSSTVEAKGVAPVATAAPQIIGSPTVGSKLTCTPGTWSGKPPVVEADLHYRWLLEGSSTGVEATTYEVNSGNVGHSLTCEVTATTAAGKGTKSSLPVEIPKGSNVPKNTVPPTITGKPKIGETLTCNPGEWSPSTHEVPTFTWLREGAPIEHAEADTYTLTTADAGHVLTCVVSVRDAEGRGTASVSSAEVQGSKPEAIGGAEIVGAATVGETLTCKSPEWRGAPVPALKYQWLVEGQVVASGQAWQVGESAGGAYVYCEVLAENNAGHAAAQSTRKYVSGNLPQPQGEPTITESATGTLRCNNVTWTGAPGAPRYEWLLEGNALEVETETLAILSAYHGDDVVCRVYEKNGVGVEHADSKPHKIEGEMPSGGPPEVAGELVPGHTATCLPGTWKGSPTPVLSYAWLLDGEATTNETPTFEVTNEDRGKQLACRVSAKNVEGSATATSSARTVPGLPPEPRTLPRILEGEGAIAPGSTLTCRHGEWAGAPKPALSYEWLLEGEAIPGATKETFVLEGEDEGHTIACAVVAENTAGTDVVQSVNTVHLAGERPEALEPPEVEGATQIGETVTCFAGKWKGKPKPTFEYTWTLDGSVVAGPSLSERFTIPSSALGSTIACSVTASNTEGKASAPSANSSEVTPRAVHKLAVPSIVANSKPVVTHKTSAVQIAESLGVQLTAAAKAAHIRRLLKSSGYSFELRPLVAGTLQLSWTQPEASKKHGATKASQRVIAWVTTKFASATRSKVDLRLTATGRKLLKHAKHLKLTIKALFTDAQGELASWQGTFTLNR